MRSSTFRHIAPSGRARSRQRGPSLRTRKIIEKFVACVILVTFIGAFIERRPIEQNIEGNLGNIGSNLAHLGTSIGIQPGLDPTEQGLARCTSAGSLLENTMLSGRAVVTAGFDSAAACCTKCAADPRCGGLTFNAQGGVCSFFQEGSGVAAAGE